MSLLNILPYSVGAYQSRYGEEFITSFSHASLTKGPFDPAQAQEFVEKLEKKGCFGKSSISFDAAKLTGLLEGGGFSAIAFRVCKKALMLLRTLGEKCRLKPENREICFILQFTRFVKSLEKMPFEVQSVMRSEQAAFESMIVDKETVPSGHAVSEKIGAIAPFYALKVVGSIPEIRVNGNELFQKQFSEQVRNLKDGVYFLKLSQTKADGRGKGHSAVYIKTGHVEFYFDPALGSFALFSEALKTNLIYNALLSANRQFGVDVLSFHQLEEENPVSLLFFEIPNPRLEGIIYSPRTSSDVVPVVIFSPGLEHSQNAYHEMAEELCSKGFVVMSVDHQGTVLGSSGLKESEIIAQCLQNSDNIAKLVELIREGYFDEISADAPLAVMGHSLGGSASLEACRRTSEIKAAINMDGPIITPTAVSQSVLQIVVERVFRYPPEYDVSKEFSRTNPSLTKVILSARVDELSSFEAVQMKMIDHCADFLRQHLVKGK